MLKVRILCEAPIKKGGTVKQQIYSITFLAVYIIWVVVLVAKLAGFVTLSWTLILSPIWVPVALFCCLLSMLVLVFILFFIIGLLGGAKNEI